MTTQFVNVQVIPARKHIVAEYDAKPTPEKLRLRLLANDRVEQGAVHLHAPAHVYDDQRFLIVGNEKQVLMGACFSDSIKYLSSNPSKQLRDDMEIVLDPFNDDLGYVQFVFQFSGKTPVGSESPHRDAESGQEVLINTFMPYAHAQSSAFEGVRLVKYKWWDEDVQKYVISGLRLRWLFAWFKTDEFFRGGKAAGFNLVRNRTYIDEFSSWNYMSGNGSPDAKSLGKVYKWDAKPDAISGVTAKLDGDNMRIEGCCTRGSDARLELVGPTGEGVFLEPKWTGDKFSTAVKTGALRGRYRLYGHGDNGTPIEPKYTAIDLPEAERAKKFQLAVTYDSPMCVIANYYTPERLDRDFGLVAAQGVSRVHWIEYGEWGSFWYPKKPHPFWNYYGKTVKHCGDYLTAACAAAHRQKMEFFADLKTFDVSLNCFMFDEHYRKSTVYEKLDKRYTAAIPEIAASRGVCFSANPAWQQKPNLPVKQVTFYSDISLPKFKNSRVTLFVSDDNRKFTPYRGKAVITQRTGPRAHQRWTPAGNVRDAGSTTNWSIEFSGLNLTKPHFAISISGDAFELRQRGFMFVEAVGADGKTCVVTPATSGDLKRGFYFWKGWQGWNNVDEAVIGRHAWHSNAIGVIFDEDDQMGAMLEPAYEGARKIWLGRAQRMIDAGVDGVSIRTYCHHNGPFHYLKYAFAEPVRETFKLLYGREPELRDDDYEKIRHIRGDFYTQFIRDVSKLLRGAGKKLSVELESGIEVPANVHCRMQLPMQWRKWIEEGLVDEVRVKWFSAQSIFVHEEVLPVARRHGVPVQVISRCLHTGLGHRPREFADLLAGGAVAAGFDSYNWYEQENMADTNQAGFPMLKGPIEPYFAQVRQTLREISQA